MDIIFKGRRTDVQERFRRHASAKLSKIERLDHKAIRIDVEVSTERNPRQSDRRERVELTIRSRGPVIRAEAAADDRYAALDRAFAKLEARLRRLGDRRKDKHGAPATDRGGVLRPVAEAAGAYVMGGLVSGSGSGNGSQPEPSAGIAPSLDGPFLGGPVFGGPGSGGPVLGGPVFGGPGSGGPVLGGPVFGGPVFGGPALGGGNPGEPALGGAPPLGGLAYGQEGGLPDAGDVIPIQMEGDGPVVVREKFHAAVPMSIDQALLEMELVGHDFYLFRDEACGHASVVYRRHGYQYGLIRLVEGADADVAVQRIRRA